MVKIDVSKTSDLHLLTPAMVKPSMEVNLNFEKKPIDYKQSEEIS